MAAAFTSVLAPATFHRTVFRSGLISGAVFFAAGALGQTSSSSSPLAPPANGMRRSDPAWTALTHATLHPEPGVQLENATIVFRDGVITAVLKADLGADGQPNTPDDVAPPMPVGPRVVHAEGLHIYPAFIDAYVEVDGPVITARGEGRAGEGTHWNAKVTPQRRALEGKGVDEGLAKELRELGFGAACISNKGGVFRGWSGVVSLCPRVEEDSASRPGVYREDVYQSIALDTSGGGYPNSQMGAIALVRQTLGDAAWAFPAAGEGQLLLGGPADATPSCLREISPKALDGKFVLLNTDDEIEALRVHSLAGEFSLSAVVLGCGTEFARLAAIKETGRALVLPVNFPKAPDVSSPAKLEGVELREMMTWEQAPTNPRRLAGAGVSFALTTAKLKNRGDFAKNLRSAILHGLTEDQALAALTTVPAKMLGVEKQLGTLTPGKRANILVTSAGMFDKKSKVRDVYVDGVRSVVTPEPSGLEGQWTLDLPGLGDAKNPALLMVDKDNAISVSVGDKKAKATNVLLTRGNISFAFDLESLSADAKPEAPPEQQDPKNIGAEEVVPDPEAPAKDQPAPANADAKPAEAKKMVEGVYVLSAAIERGTASGEPTKLVGQGVRDDGSRFSWSAVPDVKAIVGLWEAVFDKPNPATKLPETSLLRVATDETGAAKVFVVMETARSFSPAGPSEDDLPAPPKETAARSVYFRNNVLRYELTRDDLGGLSDGVKVRAVFDPAGSTKTLRGTVTSSAGESKFVARPRPTPKDDKDHVSPFTGSWRIIEQDGVMSKDDDKSRATLKIESKKLTLTIKRDGKDDIKVSTEDLGYDLGFLTFSHDLAPLGSPEHPLEGKSVDKVQMVAGMLLGQSSLPDNTTHTYKATRDFGDKKSDGDEDDDAALKERIAQIPEALGLPFGPYELFAQPEQRSVLIKNATLWTNTQDTSGGGGDGSGVPMKPAVGDVLMSNGTIQAVGQFKVELSADTLVIDGTGKHVTPGIIDAHSHTGISRGVNEGGQAVTAEVRIQDVTNPDAVSWYRQLAGGVTSVLSLHGSANAIGGQSQVNKVRWGCAMPKDMHFVGAIPGIKFALGENPRQVNWQPGDDHSRYPHSRMGVEMLIRDRFTAAKEYAGAKLDATKPQPRRDLELEALEEVLAGGRLVHCHSYRQDEILMLAQVAKDFGFKIGTYQHILEGYKVADVVRDSSGGGSGFADWWAYKVEVQDAIPQGLPLMQLVGATTSFNSDSDELARRLNTEAAKAVKYGEALGGISPELALRFVTLHPAKQLRIDDRVGALKVGLDADVVVWSGSPLSTLSKAERTFVDGREMFSLEQDGKHRAHIEQERLRLSQKLLKEAKKSKKKGEGSGKDEEKTPAEGLGKPKLPPKQAERMRAIYEAMLRSGKDPRSAPGVCGCEACEE